MLRLFLLSALVGASEACGSAFYRQPDPVYRDRYIYDRSHHEGYLGHSHHHDYDFDPNMVRDRELTFFWAMSDESSIRIMWVPEWRLENRQRYPLPPRQQQQAIDFRPNSRDFSTLSSVTR